MYWPVLASGLSCWVGQRIKYRMCVYMAAGTHGCPRGDEEAGFDNVLLFEQRGTTSSSSAVQTVFSTNHSNRLKRFIFPAFCNGA